jgi:nucleotide-binding universal stress UspA family protein
VETILEQCGALGCDEIVMGTHGRGRLSSALLGSTAAGVVHGARVAVTLVKASGTPAESKGGG